MGNLRRLVQHVRQGFADPVRLGARDIPRLMERCRSATGRSSRSGNRAAHSATYERLFLDAKHNQKRLLMDDCLRCHGMHFEGGIRDLVAPVDTKGPWRLLRPELAEPARDPVPELPSGASRGRDCCHEARRGKSTPAQSAAKQELSRPSVALFDRREQRHFSVDLLPLPAMRDGARAVKIESGPAAGALLPVPRAAGRRRWWARATTARRSACTRA